MELRRRHVAARRGISVSIYYFEVVTQRGGRSTRTTARKKIPQSLDALVPKIKIEAERLLGEHYVDVRRTGLWLAVHVKSGTVASPKRYNLYRLLAWIVQGCPEKLPEESLSLTALEAIVRS